MNKGGLGMSDTISVTLTSGKKLEFHKGVTLYEIAETVKDDYEFPIMLAKIGDALKELLYTPTQDIVNLEFIDLSKKDGMRVYQRSATFLLIVAAKRVLPECEILVNHHIAGGYF